MKFIEDHQGLLPVEKLCRLAGVSRSGFYQRKSRPKSARRLEDEKLLFQIRFFFHRSRKNYGCRKIADDLKDLGLVCSKSRVHRLMRQEGLRSSHTKKFRVVTTDSKHAHPVQENILNREFHAPKPNQKWASDITYIPTQEGWLYLAAVLDLHSRKVIGLAMEDHMKTSLCTKALKSAFTFRQPPKALIHHSDRGSQYASEDYQVILKNHGCVVSMSRKGNCWDNAVVESFFKTLKVECVYQTTYSTKQQAKEDITDYIYNFYNCARKHSALDYKSPVDYELCAA